MTTQSEAGEHCIDCCCARSWKALGITEYTGLSIPEHIERLRPLLPPALQQLNDFSLDDGILHSVRVNPAKRTLRLRIGAGDSQRSYFTMVLDYADITLTEQEITLLGLLAKTGRPETGSFSGPGELQQPTADRYKSLFVHNWRL